MSSGFKAAESEPWNIQRRLLFSPSLMLSESVATLPPFSPIEGQKWFDQISSQWESQKNRFALIFFGKIQFLPPCIWNLPFMSTASDHYHDFLLFSSQSSVTKLRRFLATEIANRQKILFLWAFLANLHKMLLFSTQMFQTGCCRFTFCCLCYWCCWGHCNCWRLCYF